MELKLSCYCCGGTEFKRTDMSGLINIENINYLNPEDIKDNKVICSKCRLEDYIENLIIKIC